MRSKKQDGRKLATAIALHGYSLTSTIELSKQNGYILAARNVY